MSKLRSHPMYAATAAFLGRVHGSDTQTPGGSPTRPIGAPGSPGAASGFNGLASGSADYWRLCKPWRPCPQGFPAGFLTVPVQTAGAGGSIGGSIGAGAAGSLGWGSGHDDSVSMPITGPTDVSDTMHNGELEQFWRIWRDAGTSAEGSTGFQLNATAGIYPSGLVACIARTFTDATTTVRLKDSPGGTFCGVFARGSFAAGEFSGYSCHDDFIDVILYKWVNGIPTQLGFTGSALNQNGTVGIRCTGTTIEVLINGVSDLSVTDATHAAGYSGLAMTEDESAMLFDNFTITT